MSLQLLYCHSQDETTKYPLWGDWFIYTMECYLSNKNRYIICTYNSLDDLKGIMMSEKSRSQVVTYCTAPFIQLSWNNILEITFERWRANRWLPGVRDGEGVNVATKKWCTETHCGDGMVPNIVVVVTILCLAKVEVLVTQSCLTLLWPHGL